MQTEKRKQKELHCNVCGQDIKQMLHDHTEDYLVVEKEWNYFSAKDLTRHSFVVCEACYDRWIKSFAIPVKEEIVVEVFKF